MVKRFGCYADAPLIAFGSEFFQQATPTKQVNKSRRLVAQKFCSLFAGINLRRLVVAVAVRRRGGFAAKQPQEFFPLGGGHSAVRLQRRADNF